MQVLQKPRFTALMLACTLAAGLISGAAGPSEARAAAEVPPVLEDTREVEQFADAFFEQPEIKEHLAGAALAIVKDGKVLLQKGYGYADTDRSIPVDPERTVFRVASISKVITATAVMQLAEQGKVDLNSDLSAYTGGLQIPNETGAPLALKHLLTNATGFAYGDTSESITTDLTREAPIKSYILENKPTVVRKPGDYYRYDNFGFTLQGYVLEQVTGQPFGEYVEKHIFEPLRMVNSSFRLTPGILANLAASYNVLGQPHPIYATVPTELPGGGMLSTGSDMARFMLAQLNEGRLGEESILKEETVAEMQKPQLAIHPQLPNMAYGFEYADQQNYNGRYMIEKAGDMEGFHSGMWLIPEEKAGVFITVNNDYDIRKPFIQAFMNHYYPDVAKSKSASPAAHKPSTDLEQLTGTYSDLRNRMWTTRIRVDNGVLIAQDPLGVHKLSEMEPLLFEDEQGTKAAFKLDSSGKVQAFYYDAKSDSWAEKMPEPQLYRDVMPEHAYAPYIYHLRQLTVLDGSNEEEVFHPEQPITRGQFVHWMIRWSGIAPSSGAPAFSDVADSPYAKEIQAASEFGLIEGTSDGRFQPQALLTRQEAAAMVWRMAFNYLHAEPKEAQLSGITDDWAADAVRFVAAKHLYGPEVQAGQEGSVDYKSREHILKQEAAALLSLFADHLF